MFADATDDHQWIHVDPERAKDGPFGAPIAHGFLTLSLAVTFWTELLDVEGVTTKVNYGLDKVRFVSPVTVGARVRMNAVVAEVAEVPGGYQLDGRPDHRDRGRPQARRRRARAVPLLRLADSGCRGRGIRSTTAPTRRRDTDAQSRTGRLDGQAAPEDARQAALIHGDDRTVTYRGARRRHRPRLRRCSGTGESRKGDRVAFLGENSPEFLQVLFGAAQLGAVFVPVNTRLAAPEIAHVLTDSGARVLIHDREFAARVADARRRGPRLAHVIVTGTGRARPAARRGDSGGHADADVTLDDPAAIIYTSGTTGRAKGAVLTHRNLTWVALNCLVDYDVVSTDVALMISPLFHVASLGMGALPVILKGAHDRAREGVRARPRARADRASRRDDAERRADDVPAARRPPRLGRPPTCRTLQKLTCGGSAVPTRILNAYEERGLSFSQGYGMTEASPGATSLAPTMTRDQAGQRRAAALLHRRAHRRRARSDGAAWHGGRDRDLRAERVSAATTTCPRTTAAAFTPDGWFRSGDLGYLDADGYLFIADRLKDMIISGGENIYPAEVENLLNDIDGVTGVAVIGVPDETWGEVPWAVLTVRDGAPVTLDDVRAHLDGRHRALQDPEERRRRRRASSDRVGEGAEGRPSGTVRRGD